MKESLTLEQCLEKELESKSTKLSTTQGHIQKLVARKEAATDQAEKDRIQDLIVLHAEHLYEIENIDVEIKAQQRFDKQEEKKNKIPTLPQSLV